MQRYITHLTTKSILTHMITHTTENIPVVIPSRSSNVNFIVPIRKKCLYSIIMHRKKLIWPNIFASAIAAVGYYVLHNHYKHFTHNIPIDWHYNHNNAMFTYQ